MAFVLLVTGFPATGKTTLAKKLARSLGLPFLGRDEFKEKLFDAVGWGDAELDAKLGQASYAVFYHAAETLLEADASFVLETNFSPEHANKKLADLAKRYGCVFAQVRCYAEADTLLARLEARARSAERHPGHQDLRSREQMRALYARGKIEALDVPGELVDVDTTDLAKVDADKVVRALSASLAFRQACYLKDPGLQ